MIFHSANIEIWAQSNKHARSAVRAIVSKSEVPFSFRIWANCPGKENNCKTETIRKRKARENFAKLSFVNTFTLLSHISFKDYHISTVKI